MSHTARDLDNLTHSLVGLWCAEVVVRTRERGARPPLDPWTRAAVYVFAIVGNNAPDSDFSYSSISGKTFGYLLQHRGYTHTLPAVVGFALLMLGALALLARVRNKTLARRDWWLLAGVALLAPLLHLVMDFANNYGVHPFWPVYDGWFYGDSFFILEPSFWLVLLAPLAYSFRSKWVRWGLWVVMGLALGSLCYRPFVPVRNALLFGGLTAVLLLVARRLTPLARVALASASFGLLALGFVIGSRLTKADVRAQAALDDPRATTLDVVATPLPANPFCWSVLLVQLTPEAEYRVSIGRSAVFPAWLDLDGCPYDRAATPTAPTRALAPSVSRSVRFTARHSVPVADLRAVARERCEARAFYRFARVPYLSGESSDGARVLGDLRYDRKPGLDFSDIELESRQGRCPEHVPPWLPPRADILFGSESGSRSTILD